MAGNPLTHIMYVDDEPDMRILVQAVLEGEGIRVTLCEDGLSVLEAAHDNRPQMIVLDVMMAGMDGPAILREIQADPGLSGIPVIFLTAKTGEDDINMLKTLGAVGVIAKPFDLTALAGQIKSLWEMHHD